MTNENIECVELNYYKKSALYYFIIVLIFAVVLLILFLLFKDYGMQATLPLILIFCLESIYLLPFVFYYVYRYFYVKKNVSSFPTNIVLFDTPETSLLFRHRVSFLIEFTLEGKTSRTQTRTMFSSFPILSLDLSLFRNKKVLVAYDEDKMDVIVLKVVEASNK